jgi:hypothetical protein
MPAMSYFLFEQFRKNISVGNAAAISTSYHSITTRLNKDFYDSTSEMQHCLQVGSYGRNTAIHGVSDLDMLFELPWGLYEQYKAYQGNGPSQLLQAVRASLKDRYPSTQIKGDGQVVVVEFDKFKVEVLPAFYRAATNDYYHPDSNDGGTWKIARPQQEIAAVNAINVRTNRNYKHVCKMVRAWKNENGVPMSGILIDTLCHNFFVGCTDYDNRSYGSYPKLFVSLFSYLADIAQQEYWLAPGSGSRIASKGNFHRKAKKAENKCISAVAEEDDSKKARVWREVFGRDFPLRVLVEKSVAMDSVKDTGAFGEQFIEDIHPVDIRRAVEIECEVGENGVVRGRLKEMAKAFPWLRHGQKLRFFIRDCDVVAPYEVKWKVRNVGAEAERRGETRGQILWDKGRQERTETAKFNGDHFVECFIIKNGVCIARDRITVPIE